MALDSISQFEHNLLAYTDTIHNLLPAQFLDCWNKIRSLKQGIEKYVEWIQTRLLVIG